MDMSASRWSTGCESGWTGYLDESYYIPKNDYASHSQTYSRLNSARTDDVGEEDMSMVSDASSGPPHFQGDGECYRRSSTSRQNCCLTSVKSSKKAEKRSKKSAEQKLISKHQINQQHSYSSNHLDDTASSPAMCYSKMYDDSNPSCNQASVEHFTNFPQDISQSHFQEHSSYSNHYGFWQSSLPNNHTHSAEPSHLRGRTWE